MDWTEQDQILFSILNIEGRECFDTQIEHNSKKAMVLREKPEFFAPFGFYNPKTHMFTWQNEMNEITFDLFAKHYVNEFGTDVTIRKLCRPAVHLDEKNKNVIPYLMEVLNAAYRVIKIPKDGMYVFALIKLKNPLQTFVFSEFTPKLLLYKLYKPIRTATKAGPKATKKHKKNKHGKTRKQ